MSQTKNNINNQPPRIKRTWLGLGLVLVFILLISNFLTLSLYLKNKKNISVNSKLDNSAYPLLNPAREVIAQKDMIVNIQPLRDELNKLGVDQNLSIYFEFE